MEKIKVSEYDREDIIKVSKMEDLEKVWSLINKNENFILVAGKESHLVIANSLKAKIEDGDMELTCIEESN